MESVLLCQLMGSFCDNGLAPCEWLMHHNYSALRHTVSDRHSGEISGSSGGGGKPGLLIIPARYFLDVPCFHYLGPPHAKLDKWAFLMAFVALLCPIMKISLGSLWLAQDLFSWQLKIFWKFVSMHQLKICVNASIKVESFLIMTVSDGGDPHAHSMINENYSLNLWSYLCHVCLFVSVSSDMGIPRGLPSAAQGIKLCQNWTTHASACHHQQPALCCISVNYAATDGDTHCGVVKYVSM